jgi:hypothetical protein
MKKLSYLIVLALILGLVLTGCLLSNVGQVPTTEQSGISRSDPTVNYSDITLTGRFQAGHFLEVWDLTACDMTISFTYDVGYPDFNPTWQVEGAGVWLATDYDWTANTFDPDPEGAPTLDLDDKLILQKAGGHGEGDYNLPSIPPNPWANHRVWWDRDGVDPWQNDETANTGGIYHVVITLEATDCETGKAYMKINGLDQGFETDGNWNTIELTPAGMTFTGDMTKMQIFYGLYGYGATHSVAFEDITVDGCLAVPLVIESITIDPAAFGAETQLTADFTGPTVGTYDAIIDWGENGTSLGTVNVSEGTVTGFHTYASTGVYPVTLTLTIDMECGSESVTELTYAAVYDSSEGFVTGGGWIYSEAGAYVPDSSAEGKANFGFISKYKKGATVPTGNTEFQFKAGDLNFHSDSYDWLVIAGAKAMYKGTGTINGMGEYKFMISAIDADINENNSLGVDCFRIKIWGSTGVIYDNQMEDDEDADPTTTIGGGQIVIHKK